MYCGKIKERSSGPKLSSSFSLFSFGPETACRREGNPASGTRTLRTRAYLPQLHTKAHPILRLILVSHGHSFAQKPPTRCLPHDAWVLPWGELLMSQEGREARGAHQA